MSARRALPRHRVLRHQLRDVGTTALCSVSISLLSFTSMTDQARASTSDAVVTTVDDTSNADGPDSTINDFLDLERSLTECISSNPPPGCGRVPTSPGDRGGWQQTPAVRCDDGRNLRHLLARREGGAPTRHCSSGGVRALHDIWLQRDSPDRAEPEARTSRPGRAPVGSPSANVWTPATNVAR